MNAPDPPPKTTPKPTKDISQLKVADVMRTDMITIPSGKTIAEAIDVLINNGISGAPVVDASGSLLTVVTEFDLMQFAATDELNVLLIQKMDRLPPKTKLVRVKKTDSFKDLFKM